MNNSYEQLTVILQQLVTVHTVLIDLAEKINIALKKNDADEVQKNTFLYDEQICLLEKIEEERIQCCLKIVPENSGSVKLEKIIQISPAPTKDLLSSIRSLLKEKLYILTRINNSNSILLKEMLNAATATFDIIRKVMTKPSVYQQRGKFSYSSSGQSGFFNQTV